jgi:hypothetical protein
MLHFFERTFIEFLDHILYQFKNKVRDPKVENLTFPNNLMLRSLKQKIFQVKTLKRK